jgi:NAD(P)-dependent dehydrogenase (short-subunit alcohol dehydrogenase family)
MFDLKGKVALVTGARRGIGAACARALAEQGAVVVITDIDEGECSSVAEEIRARGGQADCFKLDVTNAGEVNDVVKRVVEAHGRLDILVNNAGIYQPKPFLEMTEEDWDRTIVINLKGQFLCARRAAEEMVKNRWGRIINVASIASGQVGVGVAASVHYTASKGGVTGMTESLAIELAPFGITANAIGPGVIDTPMVGAENIPKQQMDGILGNLPIKRMGKPEEIGAMAVYLASEEAAYTTGATFFVDGGWLAS